VRPCDQHIGAIVNHSFVGSEVPGRPGSVVPTSSAALGLKIAGDAAVVGPSARSLGVLTISYGRAAPRRRLRVEPCEMTLRRFLTAAGAVGVAVSFAATSACAASCADPDLLDGVRAVIANAPVGRVAGIAIVEFNDIEEGGPPKSDDAGRTTLLRCRSHALLNNAEERWLLYTVESHKDGKLYIRAEIGGLYDASKTARPKPPQPVPPAPPGSLMLRRGWLPQ
jgi:hypothetical protein